MTKELITDLIHWIETHGSEFVGRVEEAATQDCKEQDTERTITLIDELFASKGIPISVPQFIFETVDAMPIVEHFSEGYYEQVDVDDCIWFWK